MVTGGAGYIGAHVVAALRAAGVRVVVLDDLSNGLAHRVPVDVPFARGDVRDGDLLRTLVRVHKVTGVMHLAARKDVAESAADPLGYYRDNLDGLRSVLSVMTELRLPRLVFASSAAVYGNTSVPEVTEAAPTAPRNPYGRTKLVGEWMIGDAAAAAGFTYVCLRYFNVSGAGAVEFGDRGTIGVVPQLMRAVDAGPITIFGTDHPTPDGTCVRDWVHVADVAEAHVRAATALSGGADSALLNVGRGLGVSVREMIAAVGRAAGRVPAHRFGPARPSDAPCVVAAVAAARAQLGWRPERGLDDIVGSAWKAFVANGPAPGARVVTPAHIPAPRTPAPARESVR